MIPSSLAVLLASFLSPTLLPSLPEPGSRNVAAAEVSVSFYREVLPILTKSGCNQGACHGTPTGKNGFRLSLRGYDPALDQLTLLRESGGRRIDRLAPESSLILVKGSGQIPHEGGNRLPRDSQRYHRLRQWIEQGAVIDAEQAQPPATLVITPSRQVIDAPADRLTFQVTAIFADGHTVDVTGLSRFSVSDETVARISLDGEIRRQRRGEVAVTAEYMSRMATATVLFRDPNPAYQKPEFPANNFIDAILLDKWQELQLVPGNLSTDTDFLRRAFLDLTGQLPTPDQVREFVAAPFPEKRRRLIDQLLDSDAFADWWGQKWADRLGVNNRFVGKIGAVKYHRWIREQIAANLPEDEFARRILTAAGPNYSQPASGFYRRMRSVDLRAEEIAQLFLGVRLQCAKCHNHPGEHWTQDDYYGFAAFFQRLGFRNGPFFNHMYDKEETVLATREGEVNHPRSGQVMPPTFPGGQPASIGPYEDRREALARWLTAPENPYFAKAAVNRIWYHLFGRGLVDPVDDFRSSNPAISEALLQALAEYFVQHKYDRKELIRLIANSRVYQLSSLPLSGDDELAGRYFARYPIRRLGAEQLLDAISHATAVPEKFPNFPTGTPASALPDGEYKHPFLEAFGRPARAMACECERESDTNLSQALHLIGGRTVDQKVRHPLGRAARLAESAASTDAIIDELFLATLSRYPTATERNIARRTIPGNDRRAAVEDLLHVLLNHPEFLFQH